MSQILPFVYLTGNLREMAIVNEYMGHRFHFLSVLACISNTISIQFKRILMVN